MKRVVTAVVVVAALVMGLAMTPAAAGEANPVLEIFGMITAANGGTRTTFDLAALQKMPVTTVETATPWTDGMTKFEGVSAKSLLESVSANGSDVQATAADGYNPTIPRAELEKAIIAYSMDGTLLDPDPFGPFWIIFDYDSDAALNDETHHGYSVYQLKSLEVR